MPHEKMTLLQFFGHISLNNGPILKIQKLAGSWECPLSFYATLWERKGPRDLWEHKG